MNILVPIKRVIDANVRIRVKEDHTGVETDDVKMAMNPFCEIAVEEAIRMKEAGHAKAIVLVSAGPETCQDTIRTGLAMGADRGIHIKTNDPLEPLSIAKLIKAIAEREFSDLVILGKQSIDDENNQTGQILAAILGRPLASYVSKIEKTSGGFKIVREVDAGLETLNISSPAVMTTDLRLNEPRYASLPNIMKAKKTSISLITPEELDVNIKLRVQIIKVMESPARTSGVMVSGAAELVDKLKHEAKVI